MTQTKVKFERTTIMLTLPQLRGLRALSKRTGLTISETIRRFIDQGLAASAASKKG